MPEPKLEGHVFPEKPKGSAEPRRLSREEALKNLASAFVESLRAWEADRTESVSIYIDKTALYLLEEHNDAGNEVLALIAEDEPEVAQTLTKARDRILKQTTN